MSALTEQGANELRRFGWKLGPEFEQRYMTDSWVFNLANTVEAVAKERDQLRELIAEACAVENGPCTYDHHGYCQEHPHSGADPEEGVPCWFIRARALIGGSL